MIAITLTIVVLAVLAVAAHWLRREMAIRKAARRIDANFKRLSRQPLWSPLTDADNIPEAVLTRLQLWEGICQRELGFANLARLLEQYEDGTVLGVRSVLINADQTITATFACSHTRPDIAFRSFGSMVDNKFIYVTDSKATALTRPENFIVEQVDKNTAEVEMRNRLVQRLRGLQFRPQAFDSTESYIDFQTRMWQDSNALRAKSDYVIDLESMRKLAPRNCSEQTLKRIQKEVVRLHRKGTKSAA